MTDISLSYQKLIIAICNFFLSVLCTIGEVIRILIIDIIHVNMRSDTINILYMLDISYLMTHRGKISGIPYQMQFEESALLSR